MASACQPAPVCNSCSPTAAAKPAPPRHRLCNAGKLLLAVIVATAGEPIAARAAGTAFGVDTAEVGDPGNCKVEAWTSRANNGDGLATANPSCIVSLFTPTEISAQITRARADEAWATSIAPKAKAKLVPTAIGSFGFAAVGGASYDATNDELTSAFAYIPATLRLSEIVRINVNGGWLFDKPSERHFATYGLGLDWRLTDTVTFTAETFGQLGPSPAQAESVTRPRAQLGLRWRPVDRFSIDAIWGHNITGENAQWMTIGTTIRFPPQ